MYGIEKVNISSSVISRQLRKTWCSSWLWPSVGFAAAWDGNRIPEHPAGRHHSTSGLHLSFKNVLNVFYSHGTSAWPITCDDCEAQLRLMVVVIDINILIISSVNRSAVGRKNVIECWKCGSVFRLQMSQFISLPEEERNQNTSTFNNLTSESLSLLHICITSCRRTITSCC